jgi:molybdopterin synthase sulfur carrier subunit
VTSVRVALPSHLRTLAGVGKEVRVEVADGPTIADVLDGLEAAHPQLLGTIRDRATGERRPFMRYVASGQDLSHVPTDRPLPGAVARGDEALRIIGAIAGGQM